MLHALFLSTALLVSGLPGEEAYLEGADAERRGKYADAHAAFSRCAELDPALEPYAAVHLVRCLARGGSRNEAAAAYRRLIETRPEGPWTWMAHADFAALYEEAHQPTLARPHHLHAIDFAPRPWWMDPLVAGATENLLREATTQVQGYALLRERVETTLYTDVRLDAARKLLASPSLDDQAAALHGILRSGEIDETGAALLRVGAEAFGAGGAAAVLQQLLADGADTHPAAGDGDGSPWLRLLFAYAARKQAVSGNFDAATALARQLATLHPESIEAGETLWWLGWYHKYKGRPELAARHYQELAERCPKHDRADDALAEAIALWTAAGKQAEAEKASLRLCDAFPGSPYVPEAYYGLANAKPKEARALLEKAAESGFGNFFGHRALERLAAGKEAPGRSIPIGAEGEAAKLRTAVLEQTYAPEWDPRLEGDVRIARLRFFGGHGLEAGQWESLALAAAIEPNHPDPMPYYRALAEAGYMHTAIQFADAQGHLDADQRRLVLYPLSYWPRVQAIAKSAGVDPLLMLAIARQESTFRASIRSRSGAAGVMQIMPATADWLAEVDAGIEPEHAENLESADNSLRLGAIYLQRMIERSRGSLVYALAAYNGGPGNCDKWRKRFPNVDTETFIASIPFAETKDYVKKVLGNYAAYLSLYPVP